MGGIPDQNYTEAHLAAVVAHSSDAIVTKDLDGNVQSWNAAAERLFGWSAEEMIGQSIRRIVPPDRADEEDSILRRIGQGELVPKFQTLRRNKAGEDVPVAVTVSPIRDAEGRIIGASKIANDLREQEQLREQLSESRRQFEALANNIPQLAWMADRDGLVFWYNKRWYEFTGTTLEQMQGWGWKKVHHPDHVDRVVEGVQHSWDTGEDWEDIFPLRGADGRYRWFLSRAMAIKDEGGRILLWCGTNTDITEQREANDRIRLLMNEVNHRARNMLATIQAIVNRTVGRVDEALHSSLSRRIAALAANQDLLDKHNWAGARVADIVASQILHVSDLSEHRFSIRGPSDLMLKPGAAEALGLAIHELATNAAKYGALSNETGRIEIAWDVIDGEGEPRFEIEWCETGGPKVAAPKRTGFGSTIIRRNPEIAMHADVIVNHPPEGLVWKISAPSERVLTDRLEIGDARD